MEGRWKVKRLAMSSSGDENFERIKRLSSQLRGVRIQPRHHHHHHQEQVDEATGARPHGAGDGGEGGGEERTASPATPPPRPPRRGGREENETRLIMEMQAAKQEVVDTERLLQQQLLARLSMRKVETRLLGDIARTRRERAEFAMAMAWRLGALRASATARKVEIGVEV